MVVGVLVLGASVSDVGAGVGGAEVFNAVGAGVFESTIGPQMILK